MDHLSQNLHLVNKFGVYLVSQKYLVKLKNTLAKYPNSKEN